MKSSGGNGDSTAPLQVQVDSTNAWGSETLFQFKYFENGNYALTTALSLGSQTNQVKYLTSDGTLLDMNECDTVNGNINKLNGTNGVLNGLNASNGNNNVLPPKNCLFTVEYHGGYIAFRDKAGRYLAATGRGAVLRTRSTAVGKDELFEFVPSPLQIALRADFNNKWVSIKQGE